MTPSPCSTPAMAYVRSMESRYCATCGIELVIDCPPLISTRRVVPQSLTSSTAHVASGVCSGAGMTQKFLPPIDIARNERSVELMVIGAYDLPAASAEPMYERAPRLV